MTFPWVQEILEVLNEISVLHTVQLPDLLTGTGPY
jgi:hypothetical protein